MDNQSKIIRRRHRLLMVALFFFLASVYMLVYNGVVRFNDELQMLDITGSMVNYQDEKYDVALWYVWTNYDPLGQDQSQLYPLPNSPIEPLQSLAGTSFYLLAQALPSLGLAHAAMLLNVLVCAAMGVLMFQYTRILGYNTRVALIVALLLGICTVILPYSKTFLREPLATYLLFLTAYFLELSRIRRRRFIAAAVAAFVLAWLTKESSVMGIPALLALALSVRLTRRSRRRTDAVLLGIVLLTVGLIYSDIAERIIVHPIHLYSIYSLQSEYFRPALHTYLLSVGGSVWGTSPILLLAVPGAWLLIRQGRRRYIWVAVLVLFGFAVGHAITAGPVWSGGATWPSRFLMPVVPFLILLLLPALDALVGTQHAASLQKIPRIGLVLFGALVIYSLWWQFNATAFSWYDYPELTPEDSSGLAEWEPGLNTLRYMRPTLLTGQWFNTPLDFAWVRFRQYGWALGMAAVAVFLGFVLWRVGWRGNILPRRFVVALALVGVVLVGSLLTSIYWDDAYLGRRDALHTVSRVLDEAEQPGDVMLLSTPQYHWFYLNYRDFDETRVVSLPLAPGERGSCEEVPQVTSDEPAELLQGPAVDLVHALAAKRDRLWVLMDNGPFIPCSVRPLERFMTRYYYPIREVQFANPDPTVRLLEYSTVRSNITPTPVEISRETDLVYGDSIRVRGVKLPLGVEYVTGDVIPITLFWEAASQVGYDYTVALFLADENGVVFLDGQVVQGWDSAPGAGFAPTSTWQIGELVHDNRALRLPPALSAETYRLVVRLYRVTSDGQVMTLDVDGETVLDSDMGVLPVELMVTTLHP